MSAGGLGSIAILVLMVISGVLSIDTSYVMLVNRASIRIRKSLPVNLNPEQRLRTMRNLKRLPEDINKVSDPNFAVGQFLALASETLQDQRLSLDEVEELNRHMEALTDPDAGAGTTNLEGTTNLDGTTDTLRQPGTR